MVMHERELELRRSTFEWLQQRYEADAEVAEAEREFEERRRLEGKKALALVDQLRIDGDLTRFRDGLSLLTSPKSSPLGLSGPNGQMVVNQVTTAGAGDREVASVLADGLTVPLDDDDAVRKIDSVVAMFERIRTGNQPASGRVVPLLSTFWSYHDSGRWPARWTSAASAFDRLGWKVTPAPAQGYLDFAEVIRQLGRPEPVLWTLLRFDEGGWPGLDPTLADRVAWAAELARSGEDASPHAGANADAMLGPMRQAGDELAERVGFALDRTVTKRLPPARRTEQGVQKARTDTYVSWGPDHKEGGWHIAPGLRFALGPNGVMIALHPGYRERGWIDHAKPFLQRALLEGVEILDYSTVLREGEGSERDFFVGRAMPFEGFPWADADEMIVDGAKRCLPVLQAILTEGPKWSARREAGGSDEPADVVDDHELRGLFAEFVKETGYPRERDVLARTEQAALAEHLARKALPALGMDQFRWILNTSKYGFAGNRAVLNATLSGTDPDVVQSLVSSVVEDLLYGEGDAGTRIDRATDKLKGLGQAGAMKLLAVSEPERFLPLYPLTGPAGKLALLTALGIPDSPAGTLGERSVRANDLIRERFAIIPELKGDAWGHKEFAYWLRDRDTEVEVDEDDLDARLAHAIERCTLPADSRFLHDLVDLLEDKGQIVLFGPPGTGKTYLALELAEALAPDEERRALVQFHPSMAYEDFMEGFRPQLAGEGNLTYTLTQGPLIELANRAAEDPNHPYVLVIDEMNRANLPKVFGELLFLLEYRGRPAKLAYRAAEEPFAVPKNLWIIGTMNLADRSVGQIDAALRRRFAFVPFVPNDDQNGGLLRRFLVKHGSPTWPAELLDEVNGELEQELGHSDLLIGPSYFMKPGLDEAAMARIWQYAIEPLMSDLFHGDDKLIKRFSWSQVSKKAATPGSANVGASEEPEAVADTLEPDEL